MTENPKVALLAFAMVAPLVTGALWLFTSAVMSFVRLEWSAVTDTPLGRAVFAGAAIVLLIKSWKYAWDADV